MKHTIAILFALALAATPPWLSAGNGKGAESKPAGLEPKFEVATDRVQREHAEINELMRGERFHLLKTDAKFEDFLKAYRRSADVVETARLGFLSGSAQTAAGFMDAALKDEAWKKPAGAPLSFIFLLSLRTARDLVRVNYVRVHDRALDFEVDHLCPVGAEELETRVLCVIEIPLGILAPGSFHYSIMTNAGQYKRPPEKHPEGWEYADVSGFQQGLGMGSGGSGCTIVDPATNTVPPVKRPPVRPSALLSEARLDRAVERLRRAKFPMELDKLLEIIGLSKEHQGRPVSFGWSASGGSRKVYELTGPPIIHLLEIREDEQRRTALAAILYHRDGARRYTLYDSRMELE